MTQLKVRSESWPFVGTFTISRGSRTTSEVVVVELHRDGICGLGECVPYPRYDESVDSVLAQLQELAPALADGLERDGLAAVLKPGAARNALDCALWDLHAKSADQPVWQLAGLDAPQTVSTAYSNSLATTENMGAAARQNAQRPLLKIKLAGDGDLERVAAIRHNAPDSTLIVDANEGWSAAQVEPFSAKLAQLGVAMIEQPLPAAADAVLAEVEHPVPLCADESCHTSDDVDALAARYEVLNIKLDKTGGLTEALALKEKACQVGIDFMVGCMVGTSLAMAPAVLLAQGARYVDLDGPLLLARDRQAALHYEGSLLHPPEPALWG